MSEQPKPEVPEVWDLPRCSAIRVRPLAFGVWERCLRETGHLDGHLWPSEDSLYDPEREAQR
jgi:hypothetical protein